MKEISLNQEFKLVNNESIHLKSTDFTLTVKSFSRLKLPKGPDQFLILFSFSLGHIKEEKGLDGEYRFPIETLFIEWRTFKIYIRDMDFMAKDLTLCIVK